ncbi:hypothetical protein EST38_g8575 [Candolleomyces aberdarensis]|uniref:Uncharacterized protein n=1 Tax=Candolleomyces aberdarensis TaxID=2316362 RepID=A0A4Q2DC43_9AGAR|nr:hypothetical protein EST38_g8575 [Candolleomyces aberdarensis]
MPAPDILPRPMDSRPALGHVNLMIDTFIANASAEDLRSIMRNLLATGPPGLCPAFTNAARSRLRQTSAKSMPNPYTLFQRQTRDCDAAPLPQLYDTLTRARSLYGAGLGFSSLALLAQVVRATVGLRWEDDGDMADILAVIDADIGQAIQVGLHIFDNNTRSLSTASQSSKEEIEGGRVSDFSSAREAAQDLRRAVNESLADVKLWGGDFPYERALASLQYWKF